MLSLSSLLFIRSAFFLNAESRRVWCVYLASFLLKRIIHRGDVKDPQKFRVFRQNPKLLWFDAFRAFWKTTQEEDS